MKIRYKDITARKTFQGFWELSADVCGVYMRHQYGYYTLKEALKDFHTVANRAQELGARWIYCAEFRGY